ncbi:Thiamine pyrophosphate enzyme, C-terminal TPP-binding [Panicum miliaceum]|uniref:pyruvate decarboxylase n=1 Tax=Panicum miliaceum TaxID=4540 RepID=A0A3L6TC49_PANMI|nr:Thiamine pyrophosphate enzyme, C-terminal TPP-binding [Panicum miliaceum]
MDTTIGSVDGHRPAASGAVACPAAAYMTTTSSAPVGDASATLGRHLARRLVQVGVSDVFAVPGDFNLTLLDHLIAEPGLRLVGCCNELNAGYAADGYARARGVGACTVTFTVGGLSVLNAIAGAYSENLPLICIVGGPNSNDYGTNRILHHTIGLPDFSQELRCFQPVTCHQAVVNNLDDAHEQVDRAISTALKESKPVYISVSCNLPGLPHPTFKRDPVPYYLAPRLSNKLGLEAALQATVAFLDKAVKPVMVAGPKLRVAKAGDAFVQLSEASGYAMQYGSIGWSVGALLGYAQGATGKRKSIIFLINNGGYTIEVEIHDGPYNVIKNWNYTGLVDAIHNGEGNCWTAKVACEEELTAAIHTATGEKKDCLCFIEVMAHKDDTSKELLEWGSRVCAANSRPPNPQ